MRFGSVVRLRRRYNRFFEPPVDDETERGRCHGGLLDCGPHDDPAGLHEVGRDLASERNILSSVALEDHHRFFCPLRIVAVNADKDIAPPNASLVVFSVFGNPPADQRTNKTTQGATSAEAGKRSHEG